MKSADVWPYTELGEALLMTGSDAIACLAGKKKPSSNSAQEKVSTTNSPPVLFLHF